MRIGLVIVLMTLAASTARQVPADAPRSQDPSLVADARVSWLKTNATQIRTVDPEDQDFSDLMPLKKAIGTARIVMLGESAHGDGATSLGKSRIVEFLHQKMGFDVLVFESGIYDVTKVWESLRHGDASFPALTQGVMQAWAGSDQSQYVFDYLAANANTRHPIELAGWDSQPTGSASRKDLVKDLAAFLNGLQITSDLVIDGTASRKILDDVVNVNYMRGTPVPSGSEQAAYLRDFQTLENAIIDKRRERKGWQTGFWIQELRSLRTSSVQIWGMLSSDKAQQLKLSEERDRQGAENLLWLANERYPGHRIIVWAATWHCFRNVGFAPSQLATPGDVAYASQVTMGQRVWEKLGRDVYVIGFTAYGGNSGFVRAGKPEGGPVKQDQHPSIEMEELLNATGFEYAFLNFRTSQQDAAWLKTPIRSRPLGNSAGLRNWSEALDALFFIREQQFDTRK